MEKYEPIPVPPLTDVIHAYGGGNLEINRDNAELVLHRNYAEMDHLKVKDFGKRGLLLFNIDATPLTEYLVNRGYTVVHKEYPDEFTQKTWLSFQIEHLEQELEGKGHELDD